MRTGGETMFKGLGLAMTLICGGMLAVPALILQLV
jgi:hypothetical protein